MLHYQETSKQANAKLATQRTARRYIPEVDTLNNHRCENIRSYKFNNKFSI
jgi:hypothetical protein